MLLLVAAAADGGVLAEILRAAALVAGADVTVASLAPAVAVRLVEVDGVQLRFHHPLVRSAIHQLAEPWERQATHAALAEVLTGQPDRRAWHLSADSIDPDHVLFQASLANFNPPRGHRRQLPQRRPRAAAADRRRQRPRRPGLGHRGQ